MLRSPDQKQEKKKENSTPVFHNIKYLSAKTKKPHKKKNKPRNRKLLLSLK